MRAFIAAPLIGTIIFVTAIVFVVNISKAEGNAVTQISQEAYHNRINSIVELYRADAGSLFREDVKKVVEQALTSQCWSLFDLEVKNLPTDGQAEREQKLREARYESCQSIKRTVQSVICSNTGESVGTQCANTCASAPDYADCLARCGGPRTYGLQNWFNNINQEFHFEGMTLSPSNVENFQNFFNPRSGTGQLDLRQYIDNCRSLMRELTMDCAAFAGTNTQPPQLQCCRVDTAFGAACPSDQVIPGCDSGIFYVRVVPSQAGIFESLPRIQAKDDAGNYLRAGALAETEEILLPITFPLLKYLDASYNAYSRLAYGPNIGANDNDQEGVLDGICRAPTELCSDQARLGTAFTYPSTGGPAYSSFADAQQGRADVFFENVFLPAFDSLPQELEVGVLDTSENLVGRCSQETGSFQCEPDAETNVKNTIAALPDVLTGGPAEFYPFLSDVRFKFKLIDTDSSFRVKKDEPNEFCTTAILEYNNP